MKSPKKSILKNQAAFTLIEILIVIGLFGLLAGLGLFLSFDFYKSYAFRSERNTLVSVLEKARNQSLSNINQSPHGVHYMPNNYIIFQGSAYVAADPNNQAVPGNPVTVTWPGDFVFSQLAGESSASGTITIIDGVRSTSISINNEGRIDW